MWRITRTVHTTWFFTVLCVGIVVGLFYAQFSWVAMFASWVWIVLALVMAIVAFRDRRLFMIGVALVAGCLVGLQRGATDAIARQDITQNIGTIVKVYGIVDEDADATKGGSTVLRLRNVIINNRTISGKVWVTLKSDQDVARSSHVVVEGMLNDGFAQFVGSMYRAELLAATHRPSDDPMLGVRDHFSEHARSVIRDPEVSLGLGFLTGERRGLPVELLETLKTVGLTHIIVASGYNVTILVRLARRFFARFSRYMAVYSALVLVIGFVGVTGASPSMVRAALVSCLALGMWYIGRTFHPVTIIAFAAALTGLYDPSYVWGDMGWQLSFLAFAGVMIVAPLLQAYFFGDKKPGMVRQIVGETIAAQLLTVPLILFAFGQISLLALVANVCIVPFIPLAMVLIFSAGAVHMIIPAVAKVIGWFAEILLQGMLWVAQLFADVEGATVLWHLPVVGMIISYGVIGFFVLYLRYVTRYNLRSSSIVD